MSTTDIGATLREMLLAISKDGPTSTDHVNELCSRFIKNFLASEAKQTEYFNE